MRKRKRRRRRIGGGEKVGVCVSRCICGCVEEGQETISEWVKLFQIQGKIRVVYPSEAHGCRGVQGEGDGRRAEGGGRSGGGWTWHKLQYRKE